MLGAERGERAPPLLVRAPRRRSVRVGLDLAAEEFQLVELPGAIDERDGRRGPRDRCWTPSMARLLVRNYLLVRLISRRGPAYGCRRARQSGGRGRPYGSHPPGCHAVTRQDTTVMLTYCLLWKHMIRTHSARDREAKTLPGVEHRLGEQIVCKLAAAADKGESEIGL